MKFIDLKLSELGLCEDAYVIKNTFPKKTCNSLIEHMNDDIYKDYNKKPYKYMVKSIYEWFLADQIMVNVDKFLSKQNLSIGLDLKYIKFSKDDDIFYGLVSNNNVVDTCDESNHKYTGLLFLNTVKVDGKVRLCDVLTMKHLDIRPIQGDILIYDKNISYIHMDNYEDKYMIEFKLYTEFKKDCCICFDTIKDKTKIKAYCHTCINTMVCKDCFYNIEACPTCRAQI